MDRHAPPDSAARRRSALADAVRTLWGYPPGHPDDGPPVRPAPEFLAACRLASPDGRGSLLVCREAAPARPRFGLSVIPVARDGTGLPAVRGWQRYRADHPSIGKLHDWFQLDRLGVGVVLGAISGGLFAIDLVAAAGFGQWSAAVESWRPGLLAGLPIVATPGGGRYILARTLGAVPAGRRQVAPGVWVRGDGDFVIAPGSPADCDPSRERYDTVQAVGGIPYLDGSEAAELVRLATAAQGGGRV